MLVIVKIKSIHVYGAAFTTAFKIITRSQVNFRYLFKKDESAVS